MHEQQGGKSYLIRSVNRVLREEYTEIENNKGSYYGHCRDSPVPRYSSINNRDEPKQSRARERSMVIRLGTARKRSGEKALIDKNGKSVRDVVMGVTCHIHTSRSRLSRKRGSFRTLFGLYSQWTSGLPVFPAFVRVLIYESCMPCILTCLSSCLIDASIVPYSIL